ncbi:MAG: type II secretion system F family protein [Gemmatimonadaceae bacterium]|nr:type II secretion system F family protein [Gemmatimonadaceae bacterium]
MTDARPAGGRWRYRAAAADGAAVRGEIDAASEREAVDALRRRSLWVVELLPVEGGSRSSGPSSDRRPVSTHAMWPAWRGRWTDSDADLAVVIRALATLLGAGVPLHRALTYAAQEASTDAHRTAFGAVREAIERGDSLSVAIAAQSVFPAVFAPLIAAGEGSGTLDDSLSLLADHLERRDALRARLRSALVYPSILGVASILGVVVILLLVVPRFATLISDNGGALPMSTRLLIAVSAALVRGWWIMLLLLGVVAVAAHRAMRDPSTARRWHESRLRWPLVGRLERMQAAAGYTGTLSIGLHAGVSLLASMGLARAVVRNQHLAQAMAEAERRVQGGASLSQALSGLLPPLTERLLDAGETSGDLAGMAARAAQAADGELQRTVNQAVALIEPVMILGFGGIVGFVALALLQAIYGLNAGVL